jgi:GWxTD domain-containing protein
MGTAFILDILREAIYASFWQPDWKGDRVALHREGLMKIKFLTSNLFLFSAVAGILFVPLYAGEKKGELPQVYKKWLEEEVVYIISPLEREVFLKLTSDRERDLFKEAFWKQRDPTTSTPENEFKTEHYSRISYANHFFGRESPKAGWRTDRGRVYIILGEPNDIQRLEGKTQTYPAEIWFYQGKTDLGLPPGFNIVFFQPGGVGEYRLYSPSTDGPQALMTSYYGDPIDYIAAYNQLRELEPDLAAVSLSLIPGEASTLVGRPSLSSDLLIQRVETTPQRQIEEKYARKFLQYKDIVEVEYTANYIDSDALVKVLRDVSGVYFVHFSIEPERLSVNQFEDKYYTTLKVNGNVTTREGKPVYQFERTVSLNFDQEKMAAVSRQPLNFHDMFPLVSGTYQVSILVKNEVSKEFTSFEQTLSIPAEDPAIQMTSPILGYKVTRVETAQDNLKPFRFGAYQVYAQPNRVFLKKDALNVVFQVHGLQAPLRGQAELRYVILRDDAEFRVLKRKLSEYAGLPDVVEEFSLSEFPPAHYSLQVTLAVDGRDVVSAKDEFDVTYMESMARPWVYSKVHPPASDAVCDYFIGSQLFNLGRTEEAIARLESAHRKRPELADFAQNLAQAYMAQGEHGKAVPLLLPFLKAETPAKYELYFLLGRAYRKLGEWDQAIAVFDQAVSHYGTNVGILNALAESYSQKGDVKAALTIWEKSLELEPDQPEVRRNVEALKGKK